jgi:hypothetical protein
VCRELAVRPLQLSVAFGKSAKLALEALLLHAR